MVHKFDWRLTAKPGTLLLLCVAVALLGGAMVAQNPAPANQQPQAQETPADQASPDQDIPLVQPQPAAAAPTTPDTGSTQTSSAAAADSAPVYSLQSGLPLQSRISPLHWGHLSLLSFSAMETYEDGAMIRSGEATLASGLVIYSIEHSRSRFDLQYMPMVWYASGTVRNNFTAHALDLSTSRNFGRFWRVSLADQYHYSPNLAFMSASAFNPDFSTGLSTRNPFLLLGRTSLVNNATLDVNRQLNANNQLNLTLSNSFARLSGVSDPQAIGTVSLPADEQLYYNGQLTWSHKFNGNGSMYLSYGYTEQQERNANIRLQYQSASAGYTRRLSPTVTMSVGGGPAWSKRNLTAQGSISIFKAFRRGGVAASASRDTQFEGVLGGGFHNRYDLTFQHPLWIRWSFQVGSSYVQQRLGTSPRSSNGIMAWSTLSYRMTPSWSIYSSYFYLNFGSNLNIPTARESAVLGIRWAWSPEGSGR